MSATDATAAVQPAPLTAERPHSQARDAIWLTLRRVTVLAALTDAGYFLLFWAIGSPVPPLMATPCSSRPRLGCLSCR